MAIVPSFVNAVPETLTRQIMQEPASVFDVGMLRLEHSIIYREKQIISNYNRPSRASLEPQKNRRVSSGNVNVAYDQDADKIVISLRVGDKLSMRVQMQAGCKSGLKEISIIVNKSGPSFFEHQAGGEPPTSPSFYMAILDLFELRCYVSGRDSSEPRFRAIQTYGKK